MTQLGDILSIDALTVRDLARKAPGNALLLVVAGTPCQDNSRLKGTQRDGLAGKASGLFWELVRVVDLLRDSLQPDQTLQVVVENVSGVSPADAQAMTTALRSEPPALLDAEFCSWAKRPRLWWCTWRLCPKGPERTTLAGPWVKVTNWSPRDPRPWPPPWTLQGTCLPTLTRPQTANDPSRRDIGLENSTEVSRAQWIADRRRYQAYWYEDRNLLWANGTARMLTTEERESLMGLPKGRTEGLDQDTREQLIGNAFHPKVLARLLTDLPWTPHCGTGDLDPGLGLIVSGIDLGATRRVIHWLQGELVKQFGHTVRLIWALEHRPPPEFEQAKRLTTKGLRQPLELGATEDMTKGEAVRMASALLARHAANHLLVLNLDQGTRFQWQQFRRGFPEAQRPRIFVLDLREGAGARHPGLTNLLLENGTGASCRGPLRQWNLWSDPPLHSLVELGAERGLPGWPPGHVWPAAGSLLPDPSPLAIPQQWPCLIQDLPVGFQQPDQWGKQGVGTSINAHRSRKGQRLIAAQDLRALRELRVATPGGVQWIGVQHAAAWKAMDLRPLQPYVACNGDKCGKGPFCTNCAKVLSILHATQDHAAIATCVAAAVREIALRTTEQRTKRKAAGPPDGE